MTTAPTTVVEQPTPKVTAAGRPPLSPEHQALVDERKADAGVGRPSKRPTRDALVALQYKKMEGLQAHVLARLEKAVLDEKDPLHEMVIEKLLARVVPAAFWDSLAKQEFVASGEEKSTPSVTIIIGNQAGTAGDPAPPVNIVSEQ